VHSAKSPTEKTILTKGHLRGDPKVEPRLCYLNDAAVICR
jgi:hypothetical protein